ncbi:MAG TPA: HAMP domain-containing sensor histidine kinase [Gammaproteobacteria bacterium]
MNCRRRPFLRSLSGRLLLLFIGMAVLFVVLVGVSIGRVYRAHFEHTFRPHLIQYLDYMRADIGTPPDLQRAAALSREVPVQIQLDGPQLGWSSTSQLADLAGFDLRHRYTQQGRRYSYGYLGNQEYLLVEDGAWRFGFAVPRPSASLRLWQPLGVLLLVLALLYLATRRLVAPIGVLREGVERIGRGVLEQPISLQRRDELGELADSINQMARDIRDLLEAKRQLLLAMSHELRSPLTRVMVATELLEDGQQREAIQRELHELQRLIDELLETERLAHRHQALHRQRSDITALVCEVVAGFEQAVSVRTPPSPLFAEVDAVRVKLLLRNLLQNALRYTPDAAPPPELELTQQEKTLQFRLHDHGPGIAPEHLPHVTAPFYRVDAARQRQTGGYGLGLYLCRRIAEAHGGTLQIESQAGQGTTLIVQLPLYHHP